MMSIGLWAQEVIFTHVIDVGTGYVSRVELPVQRRLCQIFVRNVGSPDIHECFHRLTGSQRTPRIGVSQLGIRAKVNNYLGSSVGVVISLVLIQASQLGIKA